MNPTRIIVFSPFDPRNPDRWSGTNHSIYRALVENPNGVKIIAVNATAINLSAILVNKILRNLGLHLDIRFSKLFAVVAGAFLTIRLLFIQDAAVVTIAASNYVPYLRTRRRIIYISDATFRVISELYPAFKAFPEWLKKQGEANEARALRKADHVIYPSKWAAHSAEVDYKVPSNKIYEIPFGPNISEEMINELYVPKSVSGGQISVVFVSADWARKNGDQVVSICRLLRGGGLDVRLITIGNTPDHIKKIDFVDDRGFLRKSNEPELARLCSAYREAHFLLLPSTADAFGIVFSEAQAFGVPPVTCDVGGIPSAVSNGETGILLPVTASAEMFAKEIANYATDAKAYAALSIRCRNRYLEHANWRNWSKLIVQLAETRSLSS